MSLKNFRFLKNMRLFFWGFIMKVFNEVHSVKIWRCTCRWFLGQVLIWSARPSSPDIGRPAIIHDAFVIIYKNILCYSYKPKFCFQRVNLSMNNCLNVTILNKSETLPAARTLASWKESKSCWVQTWLSPPSGSWTSSFSVQRPSWCTPPVDQEIKVKSSQKITKRELTVPLCLTLLFFFVLFRTFRARPRIWGSKFW